MYATSASYFGSVASSGYSSHSHAHHSHHGFLEPIVMAYPCDDGFFFAVCEQPPASSSGAHPPAAKQHTCCSSTDGRRSVPLSPTLVPLNHCPAQSGSAPTTFATFRRRLEQQQLQEPAMQEEEEPRVAGQRRS